MVLAVVWASRFSLKDGVAKAGGEQGSGESLTHIPDSHHLGRVPVCET